MASGGGYRSNRGGGVAITHSGDVIDGGRREGKHTIDVDLRALSDEVGALVFTMSAWTGTLRTIVRPEVRCVDPDDRSGEPLATYELEGRPTGSHTAVIMCRVWRPAVGATWRVQAVGERGGLGRDEERGGGHYALSRRRGSRRVCIVSLGLDFATWPQNPK